MDSLRDELTALFGPRLRFNKSFDQNAAHFKKGMREDFLLWCQACKDGTALGSVPPKKEFRHLYVFFRKIGNSVRAVLIKEQNSDFIEISLDGHRAYDDKRLELGYKKSSYYGN